MPRRRIGPVPYVYPVPIVLVGALVDGRPNYATVGDCAIMGIKPALIAVSLSKAHHTTRGVLSQRAFSVNVPNTSDLSLVDYFGQVSGRDVNKSRHVRSFFGDLESTPMIESCPVTLECRVLHDLLVEHRHIFIGEVVQTHVDADYVTDDDPLKVASLTKLDPILYALDNRYYRVGPAIGEGYREGQGFET